MYLTEKRAIMVAMATRVWLTCDVIYRDRRYPAFYRTWNFNSTFRTAGNICYPKPDKSSPHSYIFCLWDTILTNYSFPGAVLVIGCVKKFQDVDTPNQGLSNWVPVSFLLELWFPEFLVHDHHNLHWPCNPCSTNIYTAPHLSSKIHFKGFFFVPGFGNSCSRQKAML
jgi:hypothetical protein